MSIPFLDLKATLPGTEDELDAAYRARAWSPAGTFWVKKSEAFEADLAAYCGVNYCIGVGNGLDALHLILRAMDIGPGEEVIVPSNTYIATWLAVVLCRRDSCAGGTRSAHVQSRSRRA